MPPWSSVPVAVGVAVRGRLVGAAVESSGVSVASGVSVDSGEALGVGSGLGDGDGDRDGDGDGDGATLGAGWLGRGASSRSSRPIAPTAAPPARASDPTATTRTSARA